MATKKIGIIMCGNVKNELNCSSFACHQQLNNRQGLFAYPESEGVELVGTMVCAGCPSINAHERILHRVRPLVELSQANAIHFSSCMKAGCPFTNKYKKVIEEAYPGVEVVVGTHTIPDGEDPAAHEQWFLGTLKHGLTGRRPSFTDAVMEMMAPKA